MANENKNYAKHLTNERRHDQSFKLLHILKFPCGFVAMLATNMSDLRDFAEISWRMGYADCVTEVWR